MTEEFRNELRSIGIELDQALDRCMDCEELYQTLLEMFLEDENFEELQQAVTAGNVERAFQCAHTLKGVTGNIGFEPLFSQIVPLVEIFRKGNFPADIQQNMEELTRRYNEVCSVLRKHLP